MYFRCQLLILWFLIASLSLYSQNAGPDSTIPTFRTKVNVVLVDITVLKGKEPVPDLHKEDFQVFENGQPQTIASFEEHKSPAPTIIKRPPLPPGEFTNAPTVDSADSVNVILLDALNTPNGDQAFVRSQMIRYLKDLKPGPRIAVFTLGSQLRMLQGFTTDAAVLLAALNSMKGPQTSPLLKSNGEKMDEQNTLDFMAISGATQEAINALAQFQAEASSFRTDARVRITLAALQDLARYLAAIPGRKNVMWFSGSFPIVLLPDSDSGDPNRVVKQYNGEVAKTANSLANARVSIYALSAEGLTANTVEGADQDRLFADQKLITEERSREQRGRAQESVANRNSLEQLAKDTGGEAIYDTNGLASALAKTVNDGSRYYSLTYKPSEAKTDGSFRQIRIKLASGNYKLSYRRGYYAEDSKASAPAQQGQPDPLMLLMVRGMPDFADILYRARVAPLDPQPNAGAEIAGGNRSLKPPFTRYGVDVAFELADLHLEKRDNGTYHGEIEIALVAYDAEGTPVNWVVLKPPLDFQPEVYNQMMRTGVRVHLDIDIPQGNYLLRTGIYNLRSGNAGTLGIPLLTLNAGKKN
jgi:VWFA-related protein